jgi:hypothetical protein
VLPLGLKFVGFFWVTQKNPVETHPSSWVGCRPETQPHGAPSVTLFEGPASALTVCTLGNMGLRFSPPQAETRDNTNIYAKLPSRG